MKHIMLSLLLVLVWNLDAAVQVPVIWGANTANTSNSLLVSGEVNIYDAGGTTPRTIWTDKDETSAAANPYTLDARGSALLYTTSGWIHILVTDSAGTTVYDHDNILAGALPDLTGTGAYVISVKGDANDSYVKFDAASTDDYYVGTNTALAGLVFRNMTDGVNAAWFDGGGNLVINSTKALYTNKIIAANYGSAMYIVDDLDRGIEIANNGPVSFTTGGWINPTLVVGEKWSATPSNSISPFAVGSAIVGLTNTMQSACAACFAAGFGNNLAAPYEFALGYKNDINDPGVTLGSYNTIDTHGGGSSNFSVAIGSHNTLSGIDSYALGYMNTVSGNYSIGIGRSGTVSSADSVLINCSGSAKTLNTANAIVLFGGDVGINEATPDISDGIGLHIDGSIIRLEDSKTPSSAGDTGNAGEICWDASYIYICVATDTWERAAHATW